MMAEKVLEQLDVLDKQEKILLDQRAKKNQLQTEGRKKVLVLPLTFDFRMEFEEALATPTAKPLSRTRKKKSSNIKKTKMHVSFEHETQPSKNDFEKPTFRPHFVPTNTKIEEIKPTAQIENKTSKSLDSLDHLEDDINKRKAYPQMNGSNIKENKSTRNHQLSDYYSLKKKTLVPLCFEDELKNPNAKIIISPTKREPFHTEQSETNPIIFHDTRNIQMSLLTKNRLSPYPLDNEEDFFLRKRTNFVLERNCDILKSLVSGQSITLCKPRKTTATAWKKEKCFMPFETGNGAIKEKLKEKANYQKLENGSCKKSAQTSSSLAKRIADYLDKTIPQEVSTHTDTCDQMSSPHKLSTSPVRCYSKSVKNTLKVHKSTNVTPLDDLLTLPSEN
ncbi:uncharacterized protein C1orf141 homolog [Ochotona princeps]|uniref:uncharacterized protein C1orf141 homolog n=1 Tax=Ochotona princeps TaxID=9978 RepID=UPI00271469F7|nr:uncharacterized protein C1orf141 homolog [Ochotona princeps]